MSIFSKLFGGGSGAAKPGPEPEVYKDFRIFAEPMKDGGQYRIAARIEKEIGGETRTHQMVRADTIADPVAAASASLAKAKALIDQQGETIF